MATTQPFRVTVRRFRRSARSRLRRVTIPIVEQPTFATEAEAIAWRDGLSGDDLHSATIERQRESGRWTSKLHLWSK